MPIVMLQKGLRLGNMEPGEGVLRERSVNGSAGSYSSSAFPVLASAALALGFAASFATVAFTSE